MDECLENTVLDSRRRRRNDRAPYFLYFPLEWLSPSAVAEVLLRLSVNGSPPRLLLPSIPTNRVRIPIAGVVGVGIVVEEGHRPMEATPKEDASSSSSSSSSSSLTIPPRGRDASRRRRRRRSISISISIVASEIVVGGSVRSFPFFVSLSISSPFVFCRTTTTTKRGIEKWPFPATSRGRR